MDHLPVDILRKITEFIEDRRTLYNFLSVCKHFNELIPSMSFFYFHKLYNETKQLSVFESNKKNIETLNVDLSIFTKLSGYLTNLESIRRLEFQNKRLILGEEEEDDLYIDLRKITNNKYIDFVNFKSIFSNYPDIKNKGIILDIRGKHIGALAIENFFRLHLSIDNDSMVDVLIVSGGSEVKISDPFRKKRLKVRSFFKHDDNMFADILSLISEKKLEKVRIRAYNLRKRSYNMYCDDYISIDRTSFLTLNSEITKIDELQWFLDPEFLEEIQFHGALVNSDNFLDLRRYRNIKKVFMSLCCVREISETERELYCDNDVVDEDRDFFLTIVFSENEKYELKL